MDSAQIVTETNPVQTGTKKKGITGSTLKIIAIIFMLIDHAAAVILARQLMATGYMEAMQSGELADAMGWLMDHLVLFYSYDFMRMAGRIAFPIFCFMIVEGFQKTRDVKKYLARLAVFALISEIPFDLAVTGKVFAWGHQNVFFTLFLGLFTLCVYEYFAKNEMHKVLKVIVSVTGALLPAAYITICFANLIGLREVAPLLIAGGILCVAFAIAYLVYGKKKGARQAQVLAADITVLMLVMYLADLLYTDYSGMGVLTIVVMYLLRKRKVLAMTMGCVVLCVMSFSEITAFFALIPIALYNGERGKGGKGAKYFFYAFYPAHLLLLYIISVVLGLGNVVLPM